FLFLCSVLEASLPRVHHGHAGLVARLDGFEIPVRSAGLDNCRDSFPYPDIHAVTEGKEAVGDHAGAGNAALLACDLAVYLRAGFRFRQPGIGRLEALPGKTVRELAVRLVTRNLRDAHAILLPGADAHRGPAFHVDDRIAGDARFHQPPEQQVVQL